jgi:hypothetical protein
VVIASLQDYGVSNPRELFLSGNKLLIIASTSHSLDLFGSEYPTTSAAHAYYSKSARRRRRLIGYSYQGDSEWSGVYQFSAVTTLLFDITDRTSPSLLRHTNLEGNFLSARLIDGIAIFTTLAYPHWYARPIAQRLEDIATSSRVSSRVLTPPERQLGPEPDLRYEAMDFLPLLHDPNASTWAASGTARQSWQPVCGCADVTYVSTISLEHYIVVSALSMRPDEDTQPMDVTVVAGRGGNVFASAQAIYVASNNFRWDAGEERTLVMRFAIDTTMASAADSAATSTERALASGVSRVRYGGMLKAPGSVLNQFSMDESSGHFRIATTIRQRGWGADATSESTNNIFLFDVAAVDATSASRYRLMLLLLAAAAAATAATTAGVVAADVTTLPISLYISYHLPLTPTNLLIYISHHLPLCPAAPSLLPSPPPLAQSKA